MPKMDRLLMNQVVSPEWWRLAAKPEERHTLGESFAGLVFQMEFGDGSLVPAAAGGLDLDAYVTRLFRPAQPGNGF